VLALLIIAGSSGCSFPASGILPLVVNTNTLTLEWDPPSFSFDAGPSSLSMYYVYFRRHGSTHWYFCAQAPASSSPQCVLRHSNFGDGSYDFAVSAVSESGGESGLADSQDASTIPVGGWFVIWIASG
jgi:hypothetical protein